MATWGSVGPLSLKPKRSSHNSMSLRPFHSLSELSCTNSGKVQDQGSPSSLKAYPAFKSLSLSAFPSLEARDVACLTLQANGLPASLVPLDSVEHFELKSDGTLRIQLSRQLRRRVGQLNLMYSSTVTGKLEKGKLSGVKGMKIKGMLLWMAVESVEKLEKSRVHLRNSKGRGTKDVAMSDFT